jgi:transcriptional regulator with XRE-family HTH domain
MELRAIVSIPIGINNLQSDRHAYTAPLMEWQYIKHRFIEQRKSRGLNQDDVAKAGKIRQGYISKLESNLNQGPSVEIFTKAVEGLGITVSEFFRQIERQTDADSTSLQQRDTTQPSPQSPGQPREAADGARSGVRSDPAVVRELLYDLADVLAEAAKRIPTSAHQRSPSAGARGSERAARRGSARRKKTG